MYKRPNFCVHCFAVHPPTEELHDNIFREPFLNRELTTFLSVSSRVLQRKLVRRQAQFCCCTPSFLFRWWTLCQERREEEEEEEEEEEDDDDDDEGFMQKLLKAKRPSSKLDRYCC